LLDYRVNVSVATLLEAALWLGLGT